MIADMRVKKTILVIAICLLAVFFLVSFALHPAVVRASALGKQVFTKTTLTVTAVAVHTYYRDMGQWPSSLDDLQKNSKDIVYIDWGKYPERDGWHQPIIYKPFDSSVGYGSVASFGADGRPGGTGFDEDLEVRFGVDFPTWEQIQTNKPTYTLEPTTPRAGAESR
jgi:hypothetical protein